MNRFALVVVGLALAGCSSTKVFHSAFEDITQETRSTVGDFSTYRQLITLNGLMPMHVPGMLFYEPTQNWLSSWLRRESPGLLVGISPKRSMVVEAKYDVKKGTEPEDAVAIAQRAYQDLRTSAVTAVAARLRVAMLGSLAQATEKKDEERIRMLARQLHFAQDKPTLQEIAAEQKAAVAESEKRRGALADAQSKFSSDLGHNIMVARWTKKEGFEGVAKIFDLIGLGSGREFEENGVVILAGIRVLNTFFGEDLFCMVRHARGNDAQWEHVKRVGITVNMIQARAVGYVSDVDVTSTLALSLDMSKEQLNRLMKDGLLDAAGNGSNVKADALITTAMGVSNFGRMVNPEFDHRKTRFYPAALQNEELEEEIESKRSSKYVTVSVTRVQFTEGMLDDLARAATGTMCNEELEPQRSLTETVARAKRRIETSASGTTNVMADWKENPGDRKLISDGLADTLERTRLALATCAPTIARLDGDVSAALRSAMNTPKDAPERYNVRIKSLEREKLGRPIVEALNGISEKIYGIYQKVRGGQREIAREELASVFGVPATTFKVSPTVLPLQDACGSGELATAAR
jgi:hypothetical protein